MPKFPKNRIIFLAIIISAFLLLPKISQAATYYVDGDNGANNGTCGNGTGSDACATISYLTETRGLAQNVGDIISVGAGAMTDNAVVVLELGVDIVGAGSGSVTINTTASPYIRAYSNPTGPTVNGSNDISGITFNGGGTSGNVIRSYGRNNQTIHDCVFNNFSGQGVEIHGKYGRDGTGSYYYGGCTGGYTEPTGTYCGDIGHMEYSVYPLSTDLATGIQIYNNTFTDCKLYPHTLDGALIHDNTWTMSGTRSAVGNTSYWFKGVEFYNNTVTVNAIEWGTIALEWWMVYGNSKFYNNTTNGWFSIGVNPDMDGTGSGVHTPYAYQIYNNTFTSTLTGGGFPALELMAWLQGVNIYGNYFTHSGSAYISYIAIWGRGIIKNFYIHNNVFYRDSGGPYIEVSSGYDNTDIDNIYIYNNVFDPGSDAGRWGILIHPVAGSANNVIAKNNIFNGNNGGMMAYTGTTGNILQYNDCYAPDSGNCAGGAGTITSSNNITGAPQWAGSGLRPSAYYQPTAGGNLIDAGVNVGLSYSGSAPDLGAYEYTGGSDTTPPSAPSGVMVS